MLFDTWRAVLAVLVICGLPALSLQACSGGAADTPKDTVDKARELETTYQKFEDGQISEEQLTEQAKALDQ